MQTPMDGKLLKVGFRGNKNIRKSAEWPFTTNPHFVCNIYNTVYLQSRITVGVWMLAMCYSLVVTE